MEIKFRDHSEYLPLYDLPQSFKVLQICKFYHYRYNDKFTGRSETHNAYEFFYVVSGSMHIEIEDRSFILHSNEFILVPPNKAHRMSSNKEICASMQFVFTATPLNDALLAEKVGVLSEKQQNVLQYIGHEYINNLPNDGYFLSINPCLSSSGQQQYAFGQALKNQIEFLLILITRDFLQNEAQRENSNTHYKKKQDEFINEAIRYIDDNICEILSTRTLALHFRYSVTHFGRLFKQATGYTCTEYILNAKIKKAMFLFSQENYSVQQVSDKLNFGSVQYFSKTFKRILGLTPLQFKTNCSKTNLMSTAFLMNEF